MTEKPKHRLGLRLTLIVVVTSVALSFAAGAIGFLNYSRHMTEEYIRTGYSLLRIAGNILDLSDIKRYAETLETDDKYHELRDRLSHIQRASGMRYLYIVVPSKEPAGSVFIFDCDEKTPYPLGHFDALDDGYDEWFAQFSAGERPAPIEINDNFGWSLSLYLPMRENFGRGKTVCFIAMDYSMEDIVAARDDYLVKLIAVLLPITAVSVVITLLIIRRRVVSPIRSLTQAANEFLVAEFAGETESSTLSRLNIRTGDELQSLSQAIKSMITKIHEYLTTLNIVTIKAESDPLTKLINRETFKLRVSHYLQERELQNDVDEDMLDAFFMIDIDHFKYVNDNYGHAVGDEVLSKCADALKRELRDSDLVARQGGDEFAVFCKGIRTARVAERKAQQIIIALEEIFPKGGDFFITPSIGISLCPRDGTTFQDLYNNADSALYASKENGRARYTFYGDGGD